LRALHSDTFLFTTVTAQHIDRTMAETPRMTRARSRTPAPVPAVAVGSSTSYGAAGRVNIHRNVAQPQATLEDAFPNNNNEHVRPGPSRASVKKKAGSSRASSVAPPAFTSGAPARANPHAPPAVNGDADDSRIRTAVNAEAQYAPQAPAAPVPAAPAAPLNRTEFEPSWFENFHETFRRWTPLVFLQAFDSFGHFLKALFHLLALLFGLAGAVTVLYCLFFILLPMLPRLMKVTGLRHPLANISEYEYHTLVHSPWTPELMNRFDQDLESMNDTEARKWRVTIESLQNFYIRRHNNTLIDHEAKISELEEKVQLLQELLPDVLVVDGTLELPAHLLKALARGLQDPSSPVWDAFLEVNRAQVKQLIPQALDTAIEDRHLVTAEELQEVLKGLLTGIYPGWTEVDWFYPGNGARILTHLTSTTYVPPRRWSWLSPAVRQPVEALLDWRNVGECWCAAASEDKGKAQLGVALVEPIYPMHMWLEHVPTGKTLDISVAPRHVEVWGSGDENAVNVDSCKGDPPADGFVCLGKGSYDIHKPNWVQKINFSGVRFRVDRVVVSVVDNWGGNHTCIYHVRLGGTLGAWPAGKAPER
jgi:hypothetical protein